MDLSSVVWFSFSQLPSTGCVFPGGWLQPQGVPGLDSGLGNQSSLPTRRGDGSAVCKSAPRPSFVNPSARISGEQGHPPTDPTQDVLVQQNYSLCSLFPAMSITPTFFFYVLLLFFTLDPMNHHILYLSCPLVSLTLE